MRVPHPQKICDNPPKAIQNAALLGGAACTVRAPGTHDAPTVHFFYLDNLLDAIVLLCFAVTL